MPVQRWRKGFCMAERLARSRKTCNGLAVVLLSVAVIFGSFLEAAGTAVAAAAKDGGITTAGATGASTATGGGNANSISALWWGGVGRRRRRVGCRGGDRGGAGYRQIPPDAVAGCTAGNALTCSRRSGVATGANLDANDRRNPRRFGQTQKGFVICGDEMKGVRTRNT
ncbi:hypothetical protein B0H13DRAFT_1895907 [Mycena leptocephala]|nr:hypothetical protein B0H13DRAFT_1895907 [Mycena leptocephala]